MGAFDDLKTFEREVDELFERSPLLRVPLRTVLTFVFGVIDTKFSGDIRQDQPRPDLDGAHALAARLSYLVRSLLRCPLEPIGESAASVMPALSAHIQDLLLLLQYGHFCELMPQVYRDYYSVEVEAEPTNGRHFVLKHVSEEFARHEARDIVLSTLGMSFFLTQRLATYDTFDQRAERFQEFDPVIAAPTIELFFRHYLQQGYEPPIMTDNGYQATLGSSREKFVRFRAAWIALADYCIGMAEAYARRLKKTPANEYDAIIDARHEWTTVMLNRTIVLDLIRSTAGIAEAELLQLCAFFFIDVQTRRAPHAGDGYCPPVWQLGDVLVFNPHILRLMFAARNILYVMNKTQRQRFDNFVSDTLEPQLVDDAAKILARLEGLTIVKNHSWGESEIDLLAFSATENVALHIQAKAAIPADSARMVQAVESRIAEGLEQLAALRSGGQPQIDRVLSDALQTPVTNVRVIDALLCRNGIGTSKIWSALGDVAPVNLTLLNAVVLQIERRRRIGGDFANVILGSIGREFAAELDKVCASSVQGWVHDDVVIADGTLSVPLLRLNNGYLQRYLAAFIPR